MLDAMLRQSGYRVGAYTSPHLTRYNERICIDGKQVTDEQLCQSFNRIDRARGDISLTYFEFGTLAALDIFQHAGLDIAILEVGLGGRLDARQYTGCRYRPGGDDRPGPRKMAGIYQGSHRQGKSGNIQASATGNLLRPGRAGVHRRLCAGKQTPCCTRPAGDFTAAINTDTWTWRGSDTVYEGLPKPGINNDRQVQNAAGVLMVLETLADEFPVSPETVKACLRGFSGLPAGSRSCPEKPRVFLMLRITGRLFRHWSRM